MTIASTTILCETYIIYVQWTPSQKWAQKPETKAKIDAVKKSVWAQFTKQFPNADKNQFFAQSSVDDRWNVTAELKAQVLHLVCFAQTENIGARE